MSTQTSEWYTRPKYIEAAREVLGTIDLDPASSAAANEIVQAANYYTREQNGLEQRWYGNVWLNPPYGRSAKMQGLHKSTIGLFIEKLLSEYERGNILQAIALVTTEVNAKWFYPLWRFPICFPDHRVKFIVPIQQKNKYSQMFGTSFIYLGNNETQFAAIFRRFGHIVKTIEVPDLQPLQPDMWESEVSA